MHKIPEPSALSKKTSLLTQLKQWLLQPTDIAPLIFFRIIGGTLMTIELTGGMFTDYIEELIHPGFHFSFMLTPWIKPWPETWMMYLHFSINIILGVMVVVGAYYRWATVLLCLSATSIFLMEKSLYINHIYLYCLMIFLLSFLPAHRAFSYDLKKGRVTPLSQVPAWMIYLFVFQISIVYLYAGIAKINVDWLQAQPLKMWLGNKGDHPILGGLLVQDWYPYLVAYGGLAFDLLVVPFMLWKKSRKVTFFIACFFHATNALTFGIGTFPWFSIVATTLFFPASTFRKWKWLDRHLPLSNSATTFQNNSKILYPVIILYTLLQLAVPLRQFWYEGNSSWYDEGHNFSWHMMLRTKRGRAVFYVKDLQTGKEQRINNLEYLTHNQYRKMIGKPDMLLEFAHFLKGEFESKGWEEVQVMVYCHASLNGRPKQVMLNKDIILSEQERGLGHYDWVRGLKE
ncbi:HTTM domain-containing protein [Algivirga pacifica]|uniref:HTTM-like domain-containing protein n=1 Tax=Algivirga pacifica TaxID=1162670 RepID=A0ABP9DLW5_9BACT